MIIRVEIPELELTKAIDIAESKTIRDLRDIIIRKLQWKDYGSDSRFFISRQLPAYLLSDNLDAYQEQYSVFLCGEDGLWIINEGIKIGMIFNNSGKPGSSSSSLNNNINNNNSGDGTSSSPNLFLQLRRFSFDFYQQNINNKNNSNADDNAIIADSLPLINFNSQINAAGSSAAATDSPSSPASALMFNSVQSKYIKSAPSSRRNSMISLTLNHINNDSCTFTTPNSPPLSTTVTSSSPITSAVTATTPATTNPTSTGNTATATSAEGFNWTLISKSNPLEDLPLFGSIKKKKSMQRLGKMAQLFNNNSSGQHDASSQSSSPQSSLSSSPSNHPQSSSNGRRFEWFGGVQLADIPKDPSTGCPIIIEKFLTFLEDSYMQTEGIFRISGAASVIGKLQDRLQQSQSGGADFSFAKHEISGVDGHSVASCLKLFLRKLPDPLLTRKLYSAWIAAQSTHNEQLRLYWIYHLLRALPADNFILLGRLCKFFNNLSLLEHENKMSIQNIATVIGPNILRGDENESPTQIVHNAGAVNTIVFEMIKNVYDLFDYNPQLENNSLTFIAKALYSFKSYPQSSSTAEEESRNEMNFGVGEYFFIREPKAIVENHSVVGWWMAELVGCRREERMFGFVPSNYLEVLCELNYAKTSSPVATAVPLSAVSPTSGEVRPQSAVILSDRATNTYVETAEVEIQTDPAPENKMKMLQLQRENISLRNEIIRLKSHILLLESQQQQRLSPSAAESAKSPEPTPNQATVAPATLANPPPRRTKRCPPPAPPINGSGSRYASGKENSRPVTFHEMNMKYSPQYSAGVNSVNRRSFEMQLDTILRSRSGQPSAVDSATSSQRPLSPEITITEAASDSANKGPSPDVSLDDSNITPPPPPALVHELEDVFHFPPPPILPPNV